MIATIAPPLPRRVHWVVVELDPRGEIDEHAALCLHNAIDAARDGAIEMTLVDLRDLTAITPDGVRLFVRHSAICAEHGVELGLLINAGARRGPIAEALVCAGLGEQLRHAAEARGATAAHPVGPLHAVRSVRRAALSRRARHVSPRGRRRATTA